MASDWIDVSIALRTGMVHWPGDPAPVIERALSMERGDSCNMSVLSLSAHTGTHMDAPLHFVRDGLSIDHMPLDAVMGPARVIQIADERAITATELRPHDIQKGERILFKTRNSARCWGSDHFFDDFIPIAPDAAQLLADAGVQTIGVDYLSVGGFHHGGGETHQILLGAGIWLIEGLNLASVAPGHYELLCLPLKIAGADGAPARALLRNIEG